MQQKGEAVGSSEILFSVHQSTWCHIPSHSSLNYPRYVLILTFDYYILKSPVSPVFLLFDGAVFKQDFPEVSN